MPETTSAVPAVSGGTTMEELLVIYPGAQRALFGKYHIGGCQSCGFRPEETLTEVCLRNEDLPVTEVIAHIEASHEEDLARQMTPHDLSQRLRTAPETLRLLDVRTREEHESVAIDGSRLFTQEVLQEIFGAWDRESEIVIYDHTGDRNSMDAAAYLQGHGFVNARALRGGIDAYSREADPSIPRYRIEMEDDE